MKAWLVQIIQALAFVAVILGFLVYVCETDSPGANPAAPSTAALEPSDHHPELRDPNHMLVPTGDQVPRRQREVSYKLALVHLG